MLALMQILFKFHSCQQVEKTEPPPETETRPQPSQLEETLSLEANITDKLDISSMEIVMGSTGAGKPADPSLPPQEEWLM